MIKSVFAGVVVIAVLTVSNSAQASVKKLHLKPSSLTNKSTVVKGSATKNSMVKLTRYQKTYGYGKASKKGTFRVKLHHKLHAGWKYRLTINKKGYKTVVKYVQVLQTNTTVQNSLNRGKQKDDESQKSPSNNQSVPIKGIEKPSNSSNNASKVEGSSSNSNDSLQKQREIKLADSYFEKAESLKQDSRDARSISDAIWAVYTSFGTASDQYAEMDKEISLAQSALDQAIRNKVDANSAEYLLLKYDLERAQKIKQRAQEDDIHFQTAQELLVLYGRDNFQGLAEKFRSKAEKFIEEGRYLRELAHNLYAKYGLDSNNDLEDFEW
ncbi:hypothetical protein [Secundilactobacillus folii]|uniref:Bacterial Ig domain-containing protein n=1 Tax=Secundilactobacillus folii TaxID=2678357 RepID=A0A7X2XXL4_9LACO|nr:hypothetical protein [Secundilactobacillus folii]MTV82206.1 hypothetical protein [Secundilactobacillus folii]